MNINIDDLQDPEKMRFLMKMKTSMDGLEIQRSRIYDPAGKHDAGYYMIFLRRLYREIEETAKSDSRIANLKGKNKHLYPKIKIRDDFEHNVEKDLQIDKKILVDRGIISKDSDGNIQIQTSLSRKGSSILIISGDQCWDLEKDHQDFCEIIEKYLKLYPFHSEKNQNKKST